MHKKKVLLISESVAGGLRKHLLQLIDNLDRKKFEVYFIHGTTLTDKEFTKKYNSIKEKCEVIVCKSFVRRIDLKKDTETLLFLIKQIKQIKPDVVHCHSSKAGALGRIAAKLCGVRKIVYTPHAYSFLADEFSPRRKAFFKLVERSLSYFSGNITLNVSEGEREQALKNRLGNKKKFKVIYNGLPEIEVPDKMTLRKKFDLPKGAIVIGNNARLSAQKDPLMFMKVAQKVVAQDKNFHFVWVGTGPLSNEVQNYIEKNKLSGNIHLLSDRSDSECLVKMYDLFFISSLYEGLPYAPIEALRMGVPVVGFDTVGVREVIPKLLRQCFLVTGRNVKDVVDVILNKKYLNRECINNSFNYYQELFLEDTMIEKIERVYAS